MKTPAVVAAESAAEEARRVAAEAKRQLEELQRKNDAAALSRSQSEAAALREELGRLRDNPRPPPPTAPLPPPPPRDPRPPSSPTGRLGAWVEYQRECEAQGVAASATMFAQWQAVQGLAPPPVTPPTRPAVSRVSPVAQYPAIGRHLPGGTPMAFSPPQNLLPPFFLPFRPPPATSSSVNVDLQQLMTVLGNNVPYPQFGPGGSGY